MPASGDAAAFRQVLWVLFHQDVSKFMKFLVIEHLSGSFVVLQILFYHHFFAIMCTYLSHHGGVIACFSHRVFPDQLSTALRKNCARPLENFLEDLVAASKILSHDFMIFCAYVWVSYGKFYDILIFC